MSTRAFDVETARPSPAAPRVGVEPARERMVEWGETAGPALLAVAALMLDVGAGVGSEGKSHGFALALLAVAAGLCVFAAAHGIGRFGPSPVALRFSRWRACGLLAAALCFGLEVAQRLPTPMHPADELLQLTVLGGLWALLTGWVWGRRSWARLARKTGSPEDAGPPDGQVDWRGKLGDT